MSIEERKKRERLEKRQMILNEAYEIIKKEGLENLSIRKIAENIDYSHAMIYHYFKNKEELINQYMKIGYERMFDEIQLVEEEPIHQMIAFIRNFIDVAIREKHEFKAIMLSESKQLKNYTSFLFKGAKEYRKEIDIIYQSLKKIYPNLDENNLELRSQIIWSCVFGLIVRLIIEDRSENQIKRLVNYSLKQIKNILLNLEEKDEV